MTMVFLVLLMNYLPIIHNLWKKEQISELIAVLPFYESHQADYHMHLRLNYSQSCLNLQVWTAIAQRVRQCGVLLGGA